MKASKARQCMKACYLARIVFEGQLNIAKANIPELARLSLSAKLAAHAQHQNAMIPAWVFRKDRPEIDKRRSRRLKHREHARMRGVDRITVRANV